MERRFRKFKSTKIIHHRLVPNLASQTSSQLTYTARTYSLDIATQRFIETEFLNYLTNNTTIQLCMKNLQRPTISYGIKHPNPIKYFNLFYIIQQPI